MVRHDDRNCGLKVNWSKNIFEHDKYTKMISKPRDRQEHAPIDEHRSRDEYKPAVGDFPPTVQNIIRLLLHVISRLCDLVNCFRWESGEALQ